MSDADQLKALRVRIDSLDERILELISERARCAQEVARVKTAALAEGESAVFYRPEREAWVLKHIMELNRGPLDNEVMARLFREIMSSCLALEQPLRAGLSGAGRDVLSGRRAQAFRPCGDQHPDGGDR